jgi:hypothetical protein
LQSAENPAIKVPIRQTKTSITQAAEKMNVSPRIVAEARKVATESPELAKKVESGEMTVHQAVKELKVPTRQPKNPADFPADILGNFVPDNCKVYFERKPEMAEVLKTLKQARKTMLTESDPLWLMCSPTRLKIHIDALINDISQSQPYCVCTYCRGREGGCKACHERGVMSELEYKMGENKK